jgi:cell division protein FtsB
MPRRPAGPVTGNAASPARGAASGHARPRAVQPVAAPGRDRTAGRARTSRADALEHGLLWLVAIGRRGLVIALTLVVLVAFAAGTVEQRWKEMQLRDQVAAQNAALQAAQERNAKLRAQLADSDPDAYRAWVEATARRQLNLGYPGETIYLVNWSDPPPGASPAASPAAEAAPAPAPRPEANWRKWLHMLVGE